MAKKLIFCILLCCNISHIYCQSQYRIQGTVIDSGTGNPMGGIKVHFKHLENHILTDSLGQFYILTDILPLKVSLVHSHYKKKIFSIEKSDSLIITLDPKSATGIDHAYGRLIDNMHAGSIGTVSEDGFNKGIISDPMMLIQGKIPGVQIYNRGGNPNATPFIRTRGISSVGGIIEPLYVIDGIVGASISNVDPFDIASIHVVKDGLAALYGTRSANGVVVIQTRSKIKDKEGISFNFYGQSGISVPGNGISVMDANSFVTNRGWDLGSSTNWMDEITRTGFINVQHFSANINHDKTSLIISGNIRNIEGVLQGSGFDAFNARMNLETKAFNEKLNISFSSSYTARDQDLGFPEAFNYAVFFNPTAPIRGEEVPFPFNANLYGGYYENLGLYDSYNPLAMVSLNQKTNDNKVFTLGTTLRYQINENFRLNFRIANQSNSSDHRQYYPTDAFYHGIYFRNYRRGLAVLRNEENDFSLIEGYGSYSLKSRNNHLKITGGYSHQKFNSSSYAFSLGGFPSNDIDFINSIETSSDLLRSRFIEANSDASENEKVIAFYGNFSVLFNHIFFLHGGLRYEGSTRLGAYQKWGSFYNLGVGIDLSNNLPFTSIDLFRMRLNYGKKGTLPVRAGLSQPIWRIQNQEDGGVESYLSQAFNPYLKWEEVDEWNWGIDVSTGKFNGTFEIYTKSVKDLIDLNFVDSNIYGTSQIWQNIGSVTGWGVDINLNYSIIDNGHSKYTTGINLSTTKNRLESYINSGELRGSIGFPGINPSTIKVKPGDPLGEIFGPVFKGVDDIGAPLFEDVNGDGYIELYHHFDRNAMSDLTVLGNGYPSLEIGWENSLEIGKWEINTFLRGAFGHSLVNSFRYFLEPRIGDRNFLRLSPYNYVDTELALEDLTVSRFSSLYVEKADFLKLDNITISRVIPIENYGYFRNITLSLTFQNLFTITNYTGADPEPVLFDKFETPNGIIFQKPYTDVLNPGVDRRDSYLPSRTFVLSISVDFE